MNIEEALYHIKKWKSHQKPYVDKGTKCWPNQLDHDAVDTVLAELVSLRARAEAAERERDRLIETYDRGYITKVTNGDTWLGGIFAKPFEGWREFATKAEAVRYAAGLDDATEGGES